MDNYSVFLNTNSEEREKTLKCFNSEKEIYQKNDIIISTEGKAEIVGIVEKGLVYLVGISYDGEENIIDYFEEGEIFIKEFFPNINESLYQIVAKTKCEINFCLYKEIVKCYNKNCQKHIKFIDDLILTSIKKAQIHIDILSQRTIRHKLIRYFNYIKSKNNTINFKLPLPLSDLADYLAVDRSAMMREIKKMNNDKIIISKGQNITIL